MTCTICGSAAHSTGACPWRRVAAALLAILVFALPARAHVCDGLAPTGPATIAEAAPEWVNLPCTPDIIGGTGNG